MRSQRGSASTGLVATSDAPPASAMGRLVFALTVVTALTMWSAAFAQAPQTPKAPDTIEARVRACAPCHGNQGQGTDNDYFPRLAGKPAGYLKNQLVAFRDGRRRYAPMNYLLEY